MADPIVQPEPSKPAWQSKTLVVSAIVGLLGAVALVWPQAGEWTTWLQAHGAEVAVVWGVLGSVLRLITKDRIQLRD